MLGNEDGAEAPSPPSPFTASLSESLMEPSLLEKGAELTLSQASLQTYTAHCTLHTRSASSSHSAETNGGEKRVIVEGNSYLLMWLSCCYCSLQAFLRLADKEESAVSSGDVSIQACSADWSL